MKNNTKNQTALSWLNLTLKMGMDFGGFLKVV